MAAVERIQTFVFRYPLQAPVVTSFGAMRDRPAVLVRVEDSDGAYGWGEIWCNFPHCGAEHRARLVDSVVAPKLLGREIADPAGTFRRLEAELRILALQTAEFGPLAQALAGVDVALWDLASRRADLPLRKQLNIQARDAVPAYASGVHPDSLPHAVSTARDAGYRAFKLKVGFGAQKDIEATRRLRSLLHKGERMMLDANQAWDLKTATDISRRLAEYEPDWLEEPLPADMPWQQWQALSLKSAIPLAAGENLRGELQFDAALASGALGVVQPDMCKWGGVSGCYPVARKMPSNGVTYCPHFLGAGIGLVASAQLLAAVGGSGLLEVDCNPNPLRELLADPHPAVRNGFMRLSDAAGLGVDPQLEAAAPWQCFATSSTNS